MRFKGFIGPAYQLNSKSIECQRTVNMYPEIIESGTGKEGEVMALLPTPGLTNVLDVGDGPIRLIHVDPRDTVFVASGDEMYKISYSGAIWTATLLGTLNTSNGSIRAASNLLANGDSITVFVDGEDSYAYRYLSAVETFDDYAGFSYSQVDGATNVEFIDGYFIFNKPNTNQFYASEWGSFSVDPLSFATAEGDPDNGMALIANTRDLILLNERSTEIFVNTGNADFPFERVSGGFIEVGCVAPYSVAKINGIVFWLGRDAKGQGNVYAAQGLQPQRISTHAIEQAISSYAQDDITTADAFTYSMNGHSFYVLNFPDASWVYDLSTKMWHERAYNNAGILERQRANYHAFIPQWGKHLVGDYEDNRIYELSDTVYTDDGEEIPRIRVTPHITASLKNVFHNSLTLDLEYGVGLSGSGQGIDPVVSLSWSNDGGHTWSNEMTASIGKIGERKVRAKFNRLGMARDRVYKVVMSDPVKFIVMGAEIEVEGGMS